MMENLIPFHLSSMVGRPNTMALTNELVHGQIHLGIGYISFMRCVSECVHHSSVCLFLKELLGQIEG